MRDICYSRFAGVCIKGDRHKQVNSDFDFVGSLTRQSRVLSFRHVTASDLLTWNVALPAPSLQSPVCFLFAPQTGTQHSCYPPPHHENPCILVSQFWVSGCQRRAWLERRAGEPAGQVLR